MMGFGMGFGLFFLVLIFGGVILLGVWLVKALFPGGDQRTHPTQSLERSAREILDRRYARGEITREQYERMKEDLAG